MASVLAVMWVWAGKLLEVGIPVVGIAARGIDAGFGSRVRALLSGG